MSQLHAASQGGGGPGRMLLPDAAGMEELGLLGTGAPGLQENPEMLFFYGDQVPWGARWL